MAPGLLYNFSSRFRCVFQSVWIGLNASSHICGGGALGRGREGDWGMLRTVYVSVFFFINCVCFVFIHIMPCYSLFAFVVCFNH